MIKKVDPMFNDIGIWLNPAFRRSSVFPLLLFRHEDTRLLSGPEASCARSRSKGLRQGPSDAAAPAENADRRRAHYPRKAACHTGGRCPQEREYRPFCRGNRVR